MAKILLEVRDNVLIASTEGVITSDTISVPCSISFSDEWAQYGKTIFFYQNPRKMHRVVVAGQSADFEVPPQAIITGGELHIGVFGNYTDSEGNPQRKVAVATSVPAAKGSYNGTDLPKPSVSEYEQIISIMMAYMDAREVAEIAKEAAEQIATDASAVKGYVDEASAHAAAAQTAAAASASARDESLAAINEALSARDEVVEVAEEALNEMGGYNAKVEKNSKRATNAEDASTVKTPDSSVAYTKTVPQNALPYAEITEIGGRTRKSTNLLPYPYDDTTKTTNGITFIDNGDGSITVNGTATADAVFNLSRVWIKATQKYFASGCPLGGSQTTYYLLPRGFGKDTGNGVLINGTSSDFSSLSQIVVTSGTTVNSLVFKPMLNEGTTAKPYEPYYEGLRSAPVSAAESVGANLIKFPYAEPTKTDSGITWTVNSDGSVTANGTATDVSTFYLSTQANAESLFSGEYFFACGGKTYSTYFGRVVLLRSDGSSANVDDYGNGCKFTLNDGDKFYILLRVQNGITVSNLTFYPMLNPGPTALPYTPYFKRAIEIPEAVRALDGYGESNPDNADEYNAIVCEDGKWKYSHKGDIEDNVWTPLAAPENTDISDILPADNFIQVEEGGTVTMVNEYGYDVPSTVVYRVPKVGDDYVMISSPNGTVYKLTVSDSGSISAVKT